MIFISGGWCIRIQLRDKVGSADTTETLLDVTALLRFVPEEVLALGELLTLALGREDGLEGIRVVARVPGLCSDGHGRGGKILHLFEMEVESFGEHGKFGHIFFQTAGVGGNEIGDDLLAEVLLAVDAVEDTLEGVELLEGGFAHELEHTVAGVLGSHLQSSADMSADEFAGVLLSGSVGCLVLTPI